MAELRNQARLLKIIGKAESIESIVFINNIVVEFLFASGAKSIISLTLRSKVTLLQLPPSYMVVSGSNSAGEQQPYERRGCHSADDNRREVLTCKHSFFSLSSVFGGLGFY